MIKTNIRFFVEDSNYRIRQKKIIRIWLSDVIVLEYKTLGDLNIILCTDSFLSELNQKYLSHDTLTDVITFDFSENNVLSGEIYISIDRIKENASIFGNAVYNELHRIMIHGLLHLCGYHDKSKKEKEQMTRKEDHYLSIRPERLRIWA